MAASSKAQDLYLGQIFQRRLVVNIHLVCWVSLKIWIFFKCLNESRVVFCETFCLLGGLLVVGVFWETGQECEYIFLYINIFPILCERYGRKQFYVPTHKSLRWIDCFFLPHPTPPRILICIVYSACQLKSFSSKFWKIDCNLPVNCSTAWVTCISLQLYFIES